MSMKINCWEFKMCGREPGGGKADKKGVCPASTHEESDGKNSGKNGGRYCWRIAGTLCVGKIQGTYASFTEFCVTCDFFKEVGREQGVDFEA